MGNEVDGRRSGIFKPQAVPGLGFHHSGDRDCSRLRRSALFDAVRQAGKHSLGQSINGANTLTRTASVKRETKETRIEATIDVDGTGSYDVATGVGFLDHMIEQLARHSLIDISLKAEGDLHIDFHHTTEDCGIVLGQALSRALGERRGITRYADCHLAMDETLTRCAVDVSGRPFLVWQVAFTNAKVGDMDTELFQEWFQAFAQNAGITLHIATLYGTNNHHIAETCFKALARSLRRAIEIDTRQPNRIPSTKGSLTG